MEKSIEKLYPVQALGHNITEILKRIVSADIRSAIENGLNNEIKYIDQGQHYTEVARIYPTVIDRSKAQVEISAAYCQFLWLICDATYKMVDYHIFESELASRGLEINNFYKYLSPYLSSKQVLRQELEKIGLGIYVDKFIDYIGRLQSFNNQTPNEIEREIELAKTLIDESKPIDFERLNQINLHGHYEELSNSVYCYGIAFILLHELSHYSLGHLKTDLAIKADEVSADESAYWSILNDVDDASRFTAVCGILSVLFSLLYLNENLEQDNEHPREDIRIFKFYDLVKDDNPKYTLLLIKSFEMWGADREDYPINLTPKAESVTQIKAYIQSHFPLKNESY